jgi:cohesin complex subunit SA-1/2
MEDSPQGLKRSRDPDQDQDDDSGEAGKADGSGGENQERSSDQIELDDDDFQETRPKPKRSRTHPPQQNLIEVVKGNGDLISKAVKIWVERYEDSPSLATTELLSMLFQACGAKYSIKDDLLDETDVDDVVVSLVNLARAVIRCSLFILFQLHFVS